MNSIIRQNFVTVVALLLLAGLIAGVQGVGTVSYPSISDDGRYVAFGSAATNLVAGDTNTAYDIFVRDRQMATTRRVSISSAGDQGDGESLFPATSSDGRYVTFRSAASNLTAGDTNAANDIFVRDRQTATTRRVSMSSAGDQADGSSWYSAISGDGRYVAFSSSATNLVTGDSNAFTDIFVRDRQTGTTTLVSKSSAGEIGNGDSDLPALSYDGRYVVFSSSADNLVTGDTNSATDIFVRDRQTATTYLVSKNTSGGIANYYSISPAISSDGRYVVFESDASNLAGGDTNAAHDIFVRDRQAATTTLVSKNSTGAQGNTHSYYPHISPDGRYVVFYSYAENLVAGDTNSMQDTFVRDRQSGMTYLVSKSSAGDLGNDDSYQPVISSGGRYVAFASHATNLVSGDTNGEPDIFVRDRQTGTTTLVSKS